MLKSSNHLITCLPGMKIQLQKHYELIEKQLFLCEVINFENSVLAKKSKANYHFI